MNTSVPPVEQGLGSLRKEPMPELILVHNPLYMFITLNLHISWYNVVQRASYPLFALPADGVRGNGRGGVSHALAEMPLTMRLVDDGTRFLQELSTMANHVFIFADLSEKGTSYAIEGNPRVGRPFSTPYR